MTKHICKIWHIFHIFAWKNGFKHLTSSTQVSNELNSRTDCFTSPFLILFISHVSHLKAREGNSYGYFEKEHFQRNYITTCTSSYPLSFVLPGSSRFSTPLAPPFLVAPFMPRIYCKWSHKGDHCDCFFVVMKVCASKTFCYQWLLWKIIKISNCHCNQFLDLNEIFKYAASWNT